MLRKLVLSLTAVIAAASITFGGSVAGAKTPSKTAASATDPILLGDTIVETARGSNGLLPQAWQYTASTSGSATGIEAYDAKGTAKLTVGLYSDSNGRPGTLLATGSIGKTRARAWDDVTVDSASVTAGTKYWLAWQSTDSFRDNKRGKCSTVDGSSSIGEVGSSWSTLRKVSGCPASFYVTGTTSTVSTAPTPPPSLVAPSNMTVPSVSGTPQQGDTLTASPGSWSGDTPISFAYRWSDGTTGAIDTLGATDVGHTVSVTVTASNDGGSASATSATVGPVIGPTPPVALVPPTNTNAPAISGAPQVGDTLTVTNGTWTGDTPMTFSVKWSDGTTGASDTLTSADVGQRIIATVTATNDDGSASASSARVGPVTAPPPSLVAPSNTTVPSVSGTPQQGDTLTASPGSWSGDTPISFAYRWSDGTTGAIDTLGATDVGHTVSVTVTASNDGGSASATSATVGPVIGPTPPVALVPPTNTNAPAISGAPQVGDTLTVTNGTWTGDTPMTFSVKWSDGTTGASDTLTSADVGQRIIATVTATNDDGSASASSAAVGPVASTGDSQKTTNCAPAASATMTNTVSHLCGFADTTNTGVPAGTTLMSVPGQITAPTAQTGSGWTYSNGAITVNAGGVLKDVTINGVAVLTGDDATVEDSEFNAAGGNGTGVIQLRHASDATVINNDIHGDGVAAPEGCDNGIRDVYGDSMNLTAENNNIWFCAAGLNNIVNGGTIEGNYIHDFGFVTTGDHLDGIQFEDSNVGEATLVQDNTILMPQGQTSPIILSNDGGGTERNRTITHNLLAGGGYCFYGSGGAGDSATGITFTNNHFSRLYYPTCGNFGTVAHWQTGGGNVTSGNVWDDTGATVQP